MSEIDRHIGARLRDQRQRVHKDIAATAHALGISVDGMRRFEEGLDRVSAVQLFELCKLLEMTPADIYGGLQGSPSDPLPSSIERDMG